MKRKNLANIWFLTVLFFIFSKSTYNLKTGKKVTSAENPGFLGGIAKAVFSAQENGPLRIFALGEKGGKILFNMD